MLANLPEYYCIPGTFLRVLDQNIYSNATPGTFLNTILDQNVYMKAIPRIFLNGVLDQPVYPMLFQEPSS
jgi:hypothetical protein